MKIKSLLAACALLTAGAALAATATPKYFTDGFADMALAMTGDELCVGITLNKTGFNAYRDALRARASADGFSNADIDTMSQSVQKDPQVLMGRFASFQSQYSIGSTDMAGTCQALKSEIGRGTNIGKMLRN